MLSFIILALTAAAPQQLAHEISLAGLGDPNSNGKSFGLAHEPSQDLLYVAICGDLPFQGVPNSAVAVIDLTTAGVVAVIPVGTFPEEIAFVHDPVSGQLVYGACTNSQSGDVTIWDAALQVVATVALPDPLGYGTCFPFGIVATPTHFLISTQDGSGLIHAISLANRALDPAAGHATGAGRLGARMQLAGNELWLADTQSLAGFSGSEGGLLRLDLGSLIQESWIVARADDFTLYPAAQDLARLPSGGAWFGGTALGGRLWRADAGGELDRALDLGGRDLYGLAADPAAHLLAACTLYGGELLLVDLQAEELIWSTPVAQVGTGHALPNDALFVGGLLCVTCQGSESLLVFDQLPAAGPPPAWGGQLTVNSGTPDRGTVLSATVVNAAGGACWLLGADDCSAAVVAGLPLRLGPSPLLLASGQGSCARTLTLPGGAAMRGRSWFLQGVVRASAGVLLPTAPRAVVVQ